MKNTKNSQALNFREIRDLANLRENKVLAKIWCYTVFTATKGDGIFKLPRTEILPPPLHGGMLKTCPQLEVRALKYCPPPRT